MFEDAASLMQTIAINLRFADVVDVAFIALFLYGVFAWLRHRVSRVVGFGIALVAVLYGVALVLDLYLTSMLFQVGVTVIALALVVVFQDDIRRLFERLRTLTVWEARRARRNTGPECGVLVDAIEDLAEQHIGALIVLPGRESVDVHLRGGVGASAELSVPLLMSIFHPKTDGHDGAVIVNDGRMERFGVHLPLSTNLDKLGRGGTRHAAGLGLAERCDAMVIVVSEERGTISVAREGQIEEVESTRALREQIRAFRSGGARVAKRRLRLPRWMTRNVGLKFASLATAMLLWGIFAFRIETIQRSFEVPIEYRGLATTWHLQEPKPVKARVDLTGSERAFDEIDPDQLKISLDMNEITEGAQQVHLTEAHLNEPEGVAISSFEPRTLRLKAHRLVEAELPIRVETTGRLPDGYVLEATGVSPDNVRVQFPRYMRDYLGEISTQTIELDTLREPTVVEADLVIPEQARLKPDEPSTVSVTLRIVAAPEDDEAS
jgi:diadenylate cyclase